MIIDHLYRERIKATSSSSITVVTSDYVPDEFYLMIREIAFYNGDASARDVKMYIDTLPYLHILHYLNSVSAGEWLTSEVKILLNPAERLTISFESIAADKVMEVHLTGYYISVD